MLVLGGYGGFGARLSRRLAASGYAVIVAGRSLAKAERFCADHPGRRPLRADGTDDIAALLAELARARGRLAAAAPAVDRAARGQPVGHGRAPVGLGGRARRSTGCPLPYARSTACCAKAVQAGARPSRGRHPLARVVARVMGFPPAGDHALHISFTEADGVEKWTRDFAGGRFRSRLSQADGMLVERFGPLRFRFAPVAEPAGLRMAIQGWSCAGIPLPLALAPRFEAREWEEDGRFHFDVPIALSGIGLVVHYRGWLEPPQAA